MVGLVAALVVRIRPGLYPDRKRPFLAEAFQQRKVTAHPLFRTLLLRVHLHQLFADLVQSESFVFIGLLLQNGKNVDQPGLAHDRAS